jgi:hypothetical protein
LCLVLPFSIFCVFGICNNGSSAVCYSTQSLLKDGTVALQSTGKGVKLRANNLRFSYTSSREVHVPKLLCMGNSATLIL